MPERGGGSEGAPIGGGPPIGGGMDGAARMVEEGEGAEPGTETELR
jgi:hypothetical protein